jgi:hypothetical protein
MSKTLPSYYLLAWHYQPVHVDNKQASSIAGLKKAVSNACAVRLSYAFNHIAGHKIPAKPPGVYGNVWKGVNGNYILGSRGFANYMKATYGHPKVHSSDDHLASFTERCGILFYDVRIWKDAYGHIALWNGKEGYYGAYFKEAKKVSFWEMPSDLGALISAAL